MLRDSYQNVEIIQGSFKRFLTLDDLHQMALIGLHVTQYMYVLFDKVHIYIQKSQFTLASYGQKCIVSNKHPMKVQRATSDYRNTHHKH